jgi:hypothetical protein
MAKTTLKGQAMDPDAVLPLTLDRDNGRVSLPGGLIARDTGMGYNPLGYKALQVGDSTGNHVLALGVDPSLIPGGNFFGSGGEIVIPKTTTLLQANAENTDWVASLTIKSDRIHTADWQALPLASGWRNYGVGEQAAQVKRVGDIVRLRGLVTSDSNLWSNYTIMATLPVGFRPPTTVRCLVYGNNNAFLYVYVATSGYVSYYAGGAGSGGIALDQISFSTVT